MPKNSFLLNQDSDWFATTPNAKNTLPNAAQSWLYEAGSLTKRLKRIYGKAVQVEVLYHRQNTAFLGEYQALHLPPQRYHLIREVLLHANGSPLILARTVLPYKTSTAAKRNLAHLGNRPLGEVIFAYPKLQKKTVQISRIRPKIWTDELLAICTISQAIWGRRTIYVIRQQPLLINEFFMPQLLDGFDP